MYRGNTLLFVSLKGESQDKIIPLIPKLVRKKFSTGQMPSQIIAYYPGLSTVLKAEIDRASQTVSRGFLRNLTRGVAESLNP